MNDQEDGPYQHFRVMYKNISSESVTGKVILQDTLRSKTGFLTVM